MKIANFYGRLTYPKYRDYSTALTHWNRFNRKLSSSRCFASAIFQNCRDWYHGWAADFDDYRNSVTDLTKTVWNDSVICFDVFWNVNRNSEMSHVRCFQSVTNIAISGRSFVSSENLSAKFGTVWNTLLMELSPSDAVCLITVQVLFHDRFWCFSFDIILFNFTS